MGTPASLILNETVLYFQYNVSLYSPTLSESVYAVIKKLFFPVHSIFPESSSAKLKYTVEKYVYPHETYLGQMPSLHCPYSLKVCNYMEKLRHVAFPEFISYLLK